MDITIILIILLCLNLISGADICGSKGLKKFVNKIHLPQTRFEEAVIDVGEVFDFGNSFMKIYPKIAEKLSEIDQLHEIKWQNMTPISYDKEVLIKKGRFSEAVKLCGDINMTVYSPQTNHDFSEIKDLVVEKGFKNFTFAVIAAGKYLFGMGSKNVLFHNPSTNSSLTDGLATVDIEKNGIKYNEIAGTDSVNVVCARDVFPASPPSKSYVASWLNLVNEFLEVGRELKKIFPAAWKRLENFKLTLSRPADYIWSASLNLGRTLTTLKNLLFDWNVNPRYFGDVMAAVSDIRKLYLAMKKFNDHGPPKLSINLPNDNNIDEVEFTVDQRSGDGHLLTGTYASTTWHPGALYLILPYRTQSDLRPADAYYLSSVDLETGILIDKDGLTCDNLLSPYPKCQIDYSSSLQQSCLDYYKSRNVNTYDCELERNTGPLVSVTDCTGEETILISTPKESVVNVECMDGKSELSLIPGNNFITSSCSLELDGIMVHPIKNNDSISKTRIIRQDPINFELDLSFEQQLFQKKLFYIGIPVAMILIFLILIAILRECIVTQVTKALNKFKSTESSTSNQNEVELRPLNNPVSLIVNNMIPQSNLQSPFNEMPRLRPL